MHQLSIDTTCHIQHFLFRDGASELTLELLDAAFIDSGLSCAICDLGEENLDQPGLEAFYVEQP